MINHHNYLIIRDDAIPGLIMFNPGSKKESADIPVSSLILSHPLQLVG
jgi:hypothetical protein